MEGHYTIDPSGGYSSCGVAWTKASVFAEMALQSKALVPFWAPLIAIKVGPAYLLWKKAGSMAFVCLSLLVMHDLSQRDCIPCRGDVPPLAAAELNALSDQLDSGWEVIRGHHLQREFEFDDFLSAMGFTVGVGEMAEEQGHHPDIHLSWGKVKILVWTHKIDGLTESDFILAAKADAIYSQVH
jgi:4a-hydroxytetrahydrobiopterin dehydratase